MGLLYTTLGKTVFSANMLMAVRRKLTSIMALDTVLPSVAYNKSIMLSAAGV
jgi:hypothetical protein